MIDIKDIINISKKYFDIAGVCKPKIPKYFKNIYKNWIKKGYHADMYYLEKNIQKKLNPKLVMKDIKNVIVVGLNYYQKDFYSKYKIAKFALGDDYHKKIEKKQKLLINDIKSLINDNKYLFKTYVDYGYAWERLFAVMAGLGTIGKNNMFISYEYGSWVLLGVIYTNLDILNVKNYKIISKCGNCDICIKNCPNQALSEFCINSQKCISYQTIENKSKIPDYINTKGYIFGCDICQLICPQNKNKSILTKHFEIKNNIVNISDFEDENIFKEKFKNTNLYRTKAKKILLNILHNK